MVRQHIIPATFHMSKLHHSLPPNPEPRVFFSFFDLDCLLTGLQVCDNCRFPNILIGRYGQLTPGSRTGIIALELSTRSRELT